MVDGEELEALKDESLGALGNLDGCDAKNALLRVGKARGDSFERRPERGEGGGRGEDVVGAGSDEEGKIAGEHLGGGVLAEGELEACEVMSVNG
jgi:hypothetical protein